MTDATRAGSVISGVRRVGADALVVEFNGRGTGVAGWVTALDAEVRRRWGGAGAGADQVRVRDIVPAARTLLLDGISHGRGDASLTPRDADRLTRELSSWILTPPDADQSNDVEIPVIFDGPDLDEVARLWGCTAQDVIATVVGCDFTVAFCGFAPGFAYMAGLPSDLAVPRLAEPRTRVPAGAFGLAGEYAGVYPRSSPGGWQLLGTAVDVVLWDEARQPPALLVPGTRVRVVERGGQP